MEKIAKSIVMVLFLTVGINSYAQLVTTKGREITLTTVTEKEKVFKSNYFRVGIGEMNIKSHSDHSGYNIGFELMYGRFFDLGDNLYYKAEAGLSSRGYKDSYDNSQFLVESTEDLFTTNIKVTPVNIGAYYEFMRNTCLDYHVGLGVSYDFGGEFKNSDGSKTHISDSSVYRPFDFFMNMGIGLRIKDFIIDFSYQHGFVNAFDYKTYDDPIYNKSFKATSRMFMVSIGSFF